MKEYQKTIAIDFDGVIHKYSDGWQDGKIYDEPIEGAFEALMELHKKGYKLVIFSTREPYQIKDWFWNKIYECKKLYGQQAFPIEFTKEKPIAIAYIDDRGIRFTNWKDILNYF